MGIRRLLVTPQFLVDVCKNRKGVQRTLTLHSNPLPDDASYRRTIALADSDLVALELESSEWIGDSDEPLPPPCFLVAFEGDEKE